MYETLKDLYLADKSGIQNENIFITGTFKNTRPKESIKTPLHVAEKMLEKLPITWDKDTVFEPCAGRGGILEALRAVGQGRIENVFFNEIDKELKSQLVMNFPNYGCLQADDTMDGGYLFGKQKNPQSHKFFDYIIMNPPFDNAVNFLLMALNYYLKDHGALVTLFPKYTLTRLHSHPELYISMLACRKFSVEDIAFSCDYGVAVSMIHIVK